MMNNNNNTNATQQPLPTGRKASLAPWAFFWEIVRGGPLVPLLHDLDVVGESLFVQGVDWTNRAVASADDLKEAGGGNSE